MRLLQTIAVLARVGRLKCLFGEVLCIGSVLHAGSPTSPKHCFTNYIEIINVTAPFNTERKGADMHLLFKTKQKETTNPFPPNAFLQ